MLSFNQQYPINPEDGDLTRLLSEVENSKSLGFLSRKNPKIYSRVLSAIIETAEMTRPLHIRVIGDFEKELDEFINILMQDGAIERLNQKAFPGSYLYRSDPNDVDRTEGNTYI